MNHEKTLREAGKAGLTGGLTGAFFSGLMNYFLIAVPETSLASAMGNGISGLISGFMGGFMGVLFFIKATPEANSI